MMNRHQLADERSKALHRKIAAKLQQSPELWEIPEQNICRWAGQMGGVLPATYEWHQILRRLSHEDVLALLTSDSEGTALAFIQPVYRYFDRRGTRRNFSGISYS